MLAEIKKVQFGEDTIYRKQRGHLYSQGQTSKAMKNLKQTLILFLDFAKVVNPLEVIQFEHQHEIMT